jgi:hypothetical protein
MRIHAQLHDLRESMDRILRTGRKATWEFRGPDCGGGTHTVTAGSFEVSPDHRNLILLARKSDLEGHPRAFGRLSIQTEDNDETLRLHCVTLLTAEPDSRKVRLAASLVPGVGSVGPGGAWAIEPKAVLIARIYCVEFRVPSHAISVLARSDAAPTVPDITPPDPLEHRRLQDDLGLPEIE